MNYYIGSIPFSDGLQHYGIAGMKWGNRRYQNLDGSLTAAGRARYGVMGTRDPGTTKKGLTRGQKIALGVAGAAGAAAIGYGAYRLTRNRNLINLGNVRRLNPGSTRAQAASRAMSKLRSLGGRASQVRLASSGAKLLGDGGHALATQTRTVANSAKKARTVSSIFANGTKWTRKPIKNVTGSYGKYVRNKILKYGGAITVGSIVGKAGADWEKKRKKKAS